MKWFLIRVYFKLEDGSEVRHGGWFYGVDYYEALEKARCDRQWDLRPYKRVGEYSNYERVVEVKMTVKRYEIGPRRTGPPYFDGFVRAGWRDTEYMS